MASTPTIPGGPVPRPAAPPPPASHDPNPLADPDRYQLWKDVGETLFKLPTYFKSTLSLDGIIATDVFTFNTSLGATIEHQVVDALNLLRSSWDPQGKYDDYSFSRQPQRFPDVVLKPNRPLLNLPPLLGIELKGWYALAKESEPSSRYDVTPAVCSDYDRLVVFPWALTNVISGSPFLFAPYVAPARWVAEYRNWYWEFGRKTKSPTPGVTLSGVTTHYPVKSELINDEPIERDAGNNFGRFARTGIMRDYIKELRQTNLSGIPIEAWIRFFKIFTGEAIGREFDVLIERLTRERASGIAAQLSSAAKVRRFKAVVEEIADLFAGP